MEREKVERRGPGDELGVDVAELEAAAVGQGMSYDGELPGVAEWSPGREAPTASELAFGDTTPTAQSQPATTAVPDQTAKPAKDEYIPPAKVAEQPIPKGARFDPKFVSLALGKIHKHSGPKSVRLPPDVVKALEVAWQRTKKDGKEHGGNLVRTYGGNLDVRHGGNSGEFNDEWTADHADRGLGGDFLGTVHTHPYDKKKEGTDHGSFSGDDLANLSNHDARMSIVRSHDYTYMVVKTKEFDEKLHREVDSEPDSREQVFKHEAFKAQMKRCFDAAFDAQEGGHAAKIEAGVKAVCDRYHLIYYVGQGAQLSRKH